MMCAAGEDPQALILTLFIKVNITVTLHTLKSLALVSGNAQPVHVLLGPAGRIAIFFVLLIFFLLCSTGGPANLCDSVATECLSAAGCTALQQLSPHPTARSMPPCGSLQTAPPPPHTTHPPTRPPRPEQLFQNWPTCIKFTTTAAPESVFSNLRLLPCSFSVLQGSLYPEMETF